jgi:protein TonB
MFGGAPLPVVKAPVPNKIIVSQGVMAGSILSRPEPAYPAIAKQARIQGTVILSATISRAGTIENLTVVSGPAMLAQAAMDAVRNWRYRPYLLNGQPVEVQTLVNVTFTLGG